MSSPVSSLILAVKERQLIVRTTTAETGQCWLMYTILINFIYQTQPRVPTGMYKKCVEVM